MSRIPINKPSIVGQEFSCLEEALADCPCAMLLVSHDEAFLEKITQTDWLLTEDAAGDTQLEIHAAR